MAGRARRAHHGGRGHPVAALVRYHRATRGHATVAMAAVPLLLVYGLGLLFASPEARSGVDMVSGLLIGGLGVDGYLVVQLSVVAVLLVFAALRLGRATGPHSLLVFPIALEATLYALTMGGAILAVMHEVRLVGPAALGSGLVDRTVLSAGAGLHEELLFRVLLLPALALVAVRALGVPRTASLALAVVGSSLVFAAAHHLAGEPFETFAFFYRTFAGLIFAGLLLTRGFAVTAWTHSIYDFYVLGLSA